MSISDAQFAAWLEADAPRKTILVELDYVYAVHDGGTGNDDPTIGTLYFSTRAYITSASDTPASTPYVDVVEAVPTFSRQIDQTTLGGHSAASFGGLDLSNPEGLLDFMPTLAMDGSAVRCYIGSDEWARADFRLALSARTVTVTAPNSSRISIGLSDTGVLLNSAINVGFIGGTGPNAEKTKAVIRGACHNVTADLSDIVGNVYTYGDAGSVAPGFNAVRDNGLSVSDGSQIAPWYAGFGFDSVNDAITADNHPFIDGDVVDFRTNGGAGNGLTNGARYFIVGSTPTSFQLSTTLAGSPVNITGTTVSGLQIFTRFNFVDNADGTITLGHSPFGTVTCDVNGPEAGDPTRRASSIIDAMIADYTTLVGESLTVGAHASYPVGTSTDYHLGLVVAEKTNLQDVLDSIAFSAIAFWGFTRVGKFTYGRIAAGVSGVLGTLTSTRTITDDDIVAFDQLTVFNAPPRFSSWNWFYNKNWTVQDTGSLAASLDAATASLYASKGTFGTGLDITTRPPFPGNLGGTVTVDNDLESYHRTLAMSPETETLLSAFDPSNTVNITAEATSWYQTIRKLFRPWGRFVQMTLRLTAFELELGDLVTLALSRFSLSNQQAQVCGIEMDLVAGTIKLTTFHQLNSDTTTQGGWHG